MEGLFGFESLYSASSTVLLKNRMGGGIWRRGGETPSAVKWEDRIIEIRECSWSYISDSIGRAPGMFLSIFVFNSVSFICCLGSGIGLGKWDEKFHYMLPFCLAFHLLCCY